MWQVFTARKSFADPVIGNLLANRMGLHPARMLLAQLLLKVRRLLVCGFSLDPQLRQFARDGILIVENFLPPEDYLRFRQRAAEIMAAADNKTPLQDYQESGFGQPHDYAWGFDRCDGNSINRFYDLDSESDAIMRRMLLDKRLKKIVKYAAGAFYNPARFQLYRLVQGDELQATDNQREIHRDTFHPAVKLWYSLSEVKPEHGPFHYLPGSQKLNGARLKWEYQKSIQASLANKGGAFRASAEEVEQQYGAQPTAMPVAENCLVIADVFGWHNRGLAKHGNERLALYASIRPSPYGLPFVKTLKRRKPES